MSRRKAEDDLEGRATRRSRVDLSDLDESDAESLRQHLDELRRSFVDGPQGVAFGMRQLVERIAAARGYVAIQGSVLDIVSVDHPEQVAAMRRSEAAVAKAKGADLTEASRLSLLDAQALAERLLAEGRAGSFGEVVAEPPPPPPVPPPPVPAPQSSTPAAVTPLPDAHEDLHETPPDVEPHRGSEEGSDSGLPETERPRSADGTGRIARH